MLENNRKYITYISEYINKILSCIIMKIYLCKNYHKVFRE